MRMIASMLVVVLGWLSMPTANSHESDELLRRFCGDCHADGAAEGGISFDTLLSMASVPKAGDSPPAA